MHSKDQLTRFVKRPLTSLEKYQRSRFAAHFTATASSPHLSWKEELQLNRNTEEAWHLGQQFCQEHVNIKASCLYLFSEHLAMSYGWRLGGTHCGYLSGGAIPGISPDAVFIHPGNDLLLRSPGLSDRSPEWIYRVHFIHPHQPVSAFFEQPLSL